jgi:hypothetical protein
MSKKIIELYRKMLPLFSLKEDGGGILSTNFNGKSEPFIIDGKTVVLPTDNQLNSMGDKLFFHPVMEQINRGESKIVSELRRLINIKINYTIGVIALNLLNLAASPKLHGTLKPEQTEFLTKVPDVTKATLEHFNSVLLSIIKDSPESGFNYLFINRGGTLLGKKYSRVAVNTFKFIKDAENGNYSKLTKKDIEVLKQLFEFILPGYGNNENYSVGNNYRPGPYTSALMTGISSICSMLNDRINLFKEHIDQAEDLLFDLTATEYFQEQSSFAHNGNMLQGEDYLAAISREIPSQIGNEGEMIVSRPEGQQISAINADKIQQPQMNHHVVPQQPQQNNPAPQVKESPFAAPPQPKPTSLSEAFREADMRNPQQPMVQVPDGRGGYVLVPAFQQAPMAPGAYPQVMYPPPGYPQQVMPPQPYPQQMPMGNNGFPPAYGPPGYPQQVMPPQPYPQQMPMGNNGFPPAYGPPGYPQQVMGNQPYPPQYHPPYNNGGGFSTPR